MSYIINLDDQQVNTIINILNSFFYLKRDFNIFVPYLFSKFIFDTRFSLQNFSKDIYLKITFSFKSQPINSESKNLNETNNAVQYLEYYLRLINSIILTIAILIILLYSSLKLAY